MGHGLNVVTQLVPLQGVKARPAVSAFTTFQDIYGAPQKILPKSMMDEGLKLQLFAHGEFSLVSTATWTMGFWFNGAALAAPTNILGQSVVQTPGVATITSGHWQAFWMGTLRTADTGTTGGTWKGRGWVRAANSATPFNTDVNNPIPTTLALSTVTCDVTADRAIGVGWAWSANSASNTVTVDDFTALATT